MTNEKGKESRQFLTSVLPKPKGTSDIEKAITQLGDDLNSSHSLRNRQLSIAYQIPWYDRVHYIDARNIGINCEKKIEFLMRGAIWTGPDNRTLRDWELENNIKETVIRHLKALGVQILEFNDYGQLKWRLYNGLIQGQADGLVNFVDQQGILEITCLDDKNFEEIFDSNNKSTYRELVKFLKDEYCIIYDHLQLLMGMSCLDYSYLVCLKKSNSELQGIYVEFDKIRYKSLLSRATKILKGNATMAGKDMSSIPCTTCEFKDFCHNPYAEELQLIKCATCKYVEMSISKEPNIPSYVNSGGKINTGFCCNLKKSPHFGVVNPDWFCEFHQFFKESLPRPPRPSAPLPEI